MAIVEDEVRNESEEENEIEVVVEEDDAEQDSDDSDEEEDEDELEKRVAELERRIEEDPYDYDDHMQLIQGLWALSELDRWQFAFERLHQISLIRSEHWLMRMQTEVALAHSDEGRERMADMFQQAALDCYSIPVMSEWCTWALALAERGDIEGAREQLEDLLRRAGADPLSGKIFWDARLELEKAQLETMRAHDPDYKAQQDRVLWCLEETVSRPLLRGEEAWKSLQEMAATLRDDDYIQKVKKQHSTAAEYLEKISQFEDKILVTEDVEEKCSLYKEYIEKVKELSRDEKYVECDSNGILKILYDRVTTECLSSTCIIPLLVSFARLVQETSSRTTYGRVLDACCRRCPRYATFWCLKMKQAEHEGKDFNVVKMILETALSKGMELYVEAEKLWLGYLEYIRRCTDFESEADKERLRGTFRLAWDSLAEAWGAEANDCEVPVYWARLEYRRMRDPKHGKEIFEELFKYGENKTMSKYWEALISLETSKDPPLSENKLRDLYRRALKFVNDYPPSITRLWTDYERDYGTLDTLRECNDTCEIKLKEWRDNYQAMKEKMTGQKQKGKQQNKKTKFDMKKKEEQPKKGKRKSDEGQGGSEGKRKREDDAATPKEKEGDSGGGMKRSRDDDDNDDDSREADNKRQRTDSGSSASRQATRDACTLFVSNLEFKVDEQQLRDELSKYGDIVSLRVKAGVKAFGGSICYCQYKTPESVDEAVKHDRTPLSGRPMFLSRYSAKKTKPTFKYATSAEKNKLFVKNLPYAHCTVQALTDVFDKYGKLKEVRVVSFKDGKPKGLAYIEYEDDASAAQALEKTHGLLVGDRKIDVAISAPPPRQSTSQAAPPPSLGQHKANTGGMRRTQLSSLIPSVLQKASTSKAANGDHTNGDKKPMNNSDFRNMLLNK